MGSLAVVPRFEAISFFYLGSESFFGVRHEGGRIAPGDLNRSEDLRHRECLAAMPEGPHWILSYWIEQYRGAYFSRGHPVRRDCKFVGAASPTASLRELSAHVREVGKGATGARFVRYGRNRLVAHPLSQ